MALERVHVRAPEPAERNQPGGNLLQRLRFQPVEAALRVHAGLHETGVAQYAQVLRHRRLRPTKLTMKRSLRFSGAAALVAVAITATSTQAQAPAGPQMRGDGPPPQAKPF